MIVKRIDCDLDVVLVVDLEFSVLDHDVYCTTGECVGVILAGAVCFVFGFIFRPTIPWQPGTIKDGAEFSITQRDHLSADLLSLPDLSHIFPLKWKIGIGFRLLLSLSKGSEEEQRKCEVKFQHGSLLFQR